MNDTTNWNVIPATQPAIAEIPIYSTMAQAVESVFGAIVGEIARCGFDELVDDVVNEIIVITARHAIAAGTTMKMCKPSYLIDSIRATDDKDTTIDEVKKAIKQKYAKKPTEENASS